MTTISMSAPPTADDVVYLRPQSLGQIFSGSMHLMRRHFWRLAGVFLSATVPAHLMMIYGKQAEEELFEIAGLLILMAAYLLVPPMITVMIGDICRGMQPSLRRAASLTCRRFAVIVVNSLLMMAIIFGGLLLFVIPAFVAWVQLMFVAPVSTLEEKRFGMAAIRRSRQLGSGYHWRSFRLLLVGFAIGFTVGIVLVPLNMLLSAMDLEWLEPLVDNFLRGLTLIFSLISSVLLYYELRARKEGLTPDVLMNDLPAGR